MTSPTEARPAHGSFEDRLQVLSEIVQPGVDVDRWEQQHGRTLDTEDIRRRLTRVRAQVEAQLFALVKP